MRRRLLIMATLLGVGGLLAGCASPAADGTASPEVPTSSAAPGFALKSSAFADGAPIPAEHAMPAAGGDNVSVPLEWSSPPKATTSFAIAVVDLHPMAAKWVHWLVADIPANVMQLPAGASPASMPSGSRELRNGFGELGWGGPQPPKGSGRHSYRFTVYALDTAELGVAEDASLQQFIDAVMPHALASASIIGTFER